MQRVVVTGATSMIGSAFIKECIKNDVFVLAIARKNSIHLDRIPQSTNVDIVFTSLNDPAFSYACEKPFDVFYHFAWAHTAKDDRDSPVLQETNISASLMAVQLAKALGCKKFIGAGSQAEYGPKSGPIYTDTTPHPNSAYGMAKLSAYMLTKKLCAQLGMCHLWARIFSVYGCYDREDSMLNYAVDSFINNDIAHFSAATQDWNYIYESDAGRMFYLMGDEKVGPGLYHVADRTTLPLKWYIETTAKVFGNNPKYILKSTRDDNVFGLCPDIKESYSVLGFNPRISFEEGIAKVIEFRRNRAK